MRAETINRELALSVFEDGQAHTPAEIAVACQVHTRTAAWLLVRLEARGLLERVQPMPMVRNPDFGAFRRAA